MESAENFLKASFRILFLSVGLISLIILAGMLESRKSETKTLISYSRQGDKSVKNRKQLIGEENNGVHPKSDLDLHLMSKRRVPNRSDPIHNRRAGNSGRSPGQA